MGTPGNGVVHPLTRRGTRCRKRLSEQLEKLEPEDFTDSALQALSVIVNPTDEITSYRAADRAGSILGREVRAIMRSRV